MPIGPAPSTSCVLAPVESSKNLGTRRINGVDANGKLNTTVYPVGYQPGKGRSYDNRRDVVFVSNPGTGQIRGMAISNTR